jgi:hypothetical protein
MSCLVRLELQIDVTVSRIRSNSIGHHELDVGLNFIYMCVCIWGEGGCQVKIRVKEWCEKDKKKRQKKLKIGYRGAGSCQVIFYVL